MSEPAVIYTLCVACERRAHMFGHVLCRGCYIDGGGYV